MIMLPTMFRWATGVEALEFQVAPGLSQTRGDDEGLEDVAARVVFLVDGDGGGASKSVELRDLGRVDPTRIVAWPEGMALEDVLQPDYLLSVMQELSPSEPALPSAEEVPGSGPIAKRLKDWARAQTPEVRLIGKTALAYRVVDDITRPDGYAERNVFTPSAREILTDLHSKVERSFSSGARSDTGTLQQ